MFGKIRKRLRNRVTKRMLFAELVAMREELKDERKARAALGDTVLRRLAQMDEIYGKRIDGLEKNDMAMLESLDKWGTRLVYKIKNMQAVASSDEGDEKPTEAQIKREWFGEDE